MKRIIMMLALTALLVVALSLSALSAFAAPITCPGSQTPVKAGSGNWECQNKSGNLSNAEQEKNPNKPKDFH